MSRPGVTYQDIAAAANQAKGQGKNITIENIRAILGTGSISTISHHLKKWKEAESSTQQIASKENLPEELVSLIKGLWERLTQQAENRITEMENHYQVTILELQESQEKYKTNNHRWQQLFQQWQEEKGVLSIGKQQLEQSLQESLEQNVALTSKQAALLEQLQEKQARINELHHLHKQTQENLEHYRESAREQRLLDQQQYDQQKQEYQSEIKMLSGQSMMRAEKIAILEQQFQSLQLAHETLNKNHDLSKSTIERYATQLKETEKAKNDLQQSGLHWQKQLQESQVKLEEKSNKLIDIQTEAKVLSQQLSDIKETLKEMKSHHDLLSHDKWILAQEKSQLEGQLKQMQKMVIA
ncbi:MAG: DNA-binding protein [Gammaproteobacteria bacterium]|nr:DNA-binding protein [Gammaproteobacteria bacterium]